MELLSKETVEIIYEDITSVIESKNELIDKLISLRRIFNGIIVEISENEELSFSSIQSRIDFAIMNNDIENATVEKIRRIKNFAYKSINKKVKFSNKSFSEFVSALITLVFELSGISIPDKLKKIADKYKPEPVQQKIIDPEDYIQSIKCVVLNVTKYKHQ